MVINKSVKEFFAFFCYPVNDQCWNLDNIKTWITSPGSIEIGTTGSNVGRLLGQRIETTFVYTYTNHLREFSGHTSSGSMDVMMTNTLETIGSGTQVSHHLGIELGGLMKLKEPFAAWLMKGQIV
jgi:hypothetical protein